MIEVNQKNKRIVWDFWQHLETAGDDQLVQIVTETTDPKVIWHGPDPINELRGAESFRRRFLVTTTEIIP